MAIRTVIGAGRRLASGLVVQPYGRGSGKPSQQRRGLRVVAELERDRAAGAPDAGQRRRQRAAPSGAALSLRRAGPSGGDKRRSLGRAGFPS